MLYHKYGDILSYFTQISLFLPFKFQYELRYEGTAINVMICKHPIKIVSHGRVQVWGHRFLQCEIRHQFGGQTKPNYYFPFDLLYRNAIARVGLDLLQWYSQSERTEAKLKLCGYNLDIFFSIFCICRYIVFLVPTFFL